MTWSAIFILGAGITLLYAIKDRTASAYMDYKAANYKAQDQLADVSGFYELADEHDEEARSAVSLATLFVVLSLISYVIESMW